MTGIFLLDTNAVIARTKDDQILERLLEDAEVFLSVVVLGELFFGSEKSKRMSENWSNAEKLAASVEILVCDVSTARYYGRIKEQLRLKGRPIPDNDIWIAASAMEYGLTVLTRDEHFRYVDGLAVQGW